MVTFAALALWLTLLVAAGTPIGDTLHAAMVVRPAALLDRITRGQLLLALMMIGGASLVGWLVGHEAVRLIAMGLPEFATWATMFEVTAYLDALAAIVATASVARIAGVTGWIRAIAVPRRPKPRQSRRHGGRPGHKPANDDDDHRREVGAIAA